MKQTDFVEAVKTVVHDGGVRGVLRQLEKPSGRVPAEPQLRLSVWFHTRSADDREMIGKIIELASEHTTYAFLAVLDGMLAIEPAGPKGRLELYWQKGPMRVQLNDPNEQELTSLFKSTPEK